MRLRSNRSGDAHRSRRQHHHLRPHVDARARDARVVDHAPDDAAHATARHVDAICARIGEDARSRPRGARHVGDEHRLLGVVRAAEDAVARLHARFAVVLRDEARPAERLGAAADRLVHRVDLVVADLLHLQVALDALEGGRHRLGREFAESVLVAPHAQDRVGGAERVTEVVHRRAADAATLHDDDRAVLRLSHAALFEEARHHLVLALREVGGSPVMALLEHDHVESGVRQLGGGNGAAGAGTDHAHVGVRDDVVAAVEQFLAHAGPRGRCSSGPA